MELAEEGKPTIIAEVLPSDSRRSSAASDGSLPPGTRVMLNDQITKEQQQAGEEEDTEMARAGLETGGSGISGERGSAENTAAVLREHGDDDDDSTVQKESGQKQRVRKEKLGQKLMEVFGLPEREEVLEEMRCWLLRSISEFVSHDLDWFERPTYNIVLKGYMYLTARHICFFAHMPDREVSCLILSIYTGRGI